MSEHFVLLKFLETEEIEVVTSAWLCNNKTQCVWPNYKNPSRIVKAVGLHMPPESNWSTHDVKLLGGGHKFVTYHEAVKKLPKVMDQSDAEVGSGDGKIRIRQEASNTYESSESEGDDCHSALPPPPAPNDNLMKNVKSLLITPAAKKVTTKGQSIPKIKSPVRSLLNCV
ncbi:uncharacterized protein LOC118439369 [Folsomia candida]|uniref:uncharacterized protein LOC118439369 n=1 Tax=Folsomia candida TaxID=158441 RepID=UPI0016055C40|nr:uncharacterized protein LOC118439369 [Folsomia candida]